ncbi:MAG: hypothetical protein KGL39_51665 [Patescibacteria group bacterium]|nr:hypothetical protein [Patescibacteria group bacterium]
MNRCSAVYTSASMENKESLPVDPEDVTKFWCEVCGESVANPAKHLATRKHANSLKPSQAVPKGILELIGIASIPIFRVRPIKSLPFDKQLKRLEEAL